MTAINAIAHHSPRRISNPADFSSGHWLLQKLFDSIDVSAAVVSCDGGLVSANQKARLFIDQCEAVNLTNGILLPQSSVDQQYWIKKLNSIEVGSVVLHFFDNSTAGLVSLTGIACPPTCHLDKLIMITFSNDVICPERILSAWGKEIGLTQCETRVLALLTNGMEVRKISRTLNNSEHTVRTHVRRILDKSGVRSMRALLRQIALLPRAAVPAACVNERQAKVSFWPSNTVFTNYGSEQ